MFACDERASIFWARLIRGTVSIAKALTLRSASFLVTSALVSGSRNPISTVPSFIRSTSEGSGLRTLKTTSAS